MMKSTKDVVGTYEGLPIKVILQFQFRYVVRVHFGTSLKLNFETQSFLIRSLRVSQSFDFLLWETYFRAG